MANTAPKEQEAQETTEKERRKLMKRLKTGLTSPAASHTNGRRTTREANRGTGGNERGK